jgi:hypothetical protein
VVSGGIGEERRIMRVQEREKRKRIKGGHGKGRRVGRGKREDVREGKEKGMGR